MPRILDLTGQRFGRLTALSCFRELEKPYRWLCQCDCGNEATPFSRHLVSGVIQLCGCLRKDTSTKHGMYGSPEYKSWEGLVQRATNPKATGWHNYGGRGISVCDRWKTSFENFYADMGPKPTPSHQVDRIDNDGNYEPDNCRWVTARENCNNKKRRSRSNSY